MADINNLITDNIDVWTSAIKKRNSQGRGSNSKVELTGVKKLRELILELAVRGKLVPQDLNDEPAKVLLERIAEEKTQRIADKKINKQKPLPEITDEEKPFECPSGWAFERLANMTSLITKGSSPKWQGVSYTENPTDVLFVTSENVGAFELRLDKKKYVEKKFNEVEPRSILQKHDFLMNIVGASIGRTASYNIDVLANINQAVCLIRSFPSLSCNKYFLTFFNSNICISYMYDKQVDNARPNLSMANISKFVIPVPPLAEQHRIVAKVDELMALCDQLEQQTEQSLTAHQTLVEVLLASLTESKDVNDFQANWQRISDHFDVLFNTEHSIEQLKQTILQLAVMGKLVPQKTSDEPASVLLEKIAEEKAQLIKDKKYQKSTKLKPKVNSVKYPINWVEVQTGEVCPSIVPNRDRPKSFTGNIPWVTLPSFPKNSWYLCSDDVELSLTSDEVKLYSARLIPKNSVLMSCVGRFGLTAINLEPVSSNQQVHAFIVLDGLIPEYLSIVIQTAGRALESASTTTTIPYLNKTNCESIQFGLPPLAEQYRIVAKIDEIMALCEQLKARLSEAQITQLHLADAVVENALN